MTQVILEYSSLENYIDDSKNNPEALKPCSCSNCGCLHLVRNGSYARKINGRALLELVIQRIQIIRFKCSRKNCNQTFSILPSLLAPHRWYLWCIQQAILLAYISGMSLNAIAQSYTPCRNTIKKWIVRFIDRWEIFCNELLSFHVPLGKASQFEWFYKYLFDRWLLSKVMAVLHSQGVPIP